MKQFIKNGELSLRNGGYLSNGSGDPVNNDGFVGAQRRAEYVVTFAQLAKGKNFKNQKVDSLEELKAEVQKALAKKNIEFVTTPEKPSRKLTDELATEALKFVEFQEKSSQVEKVNNFLQEFEVLHDFEQHGLFFEQGIVKLNKLYSLEEVKQAVLETIELL